MANEVAKKETAKKPRRRVNFGQFFKEVSGEVKKLAWPNKKELVSFTLTVLAVIVVMSVLVYALDLIFGEGLALLASL